MWSASQRRNGAPDFSVVLGKDGDGYSDIDPFELTSYGERAVLQFKVTYDATATGGIARVKLIFSDGAAGDVPSILLLFKKLLDP